MDDQFCSAWIWLIPLPNFVWSICSGPWCFFAGESLAGVGPALLIEVSIKSFWSGETRYPICESVRWARRWAVQVRLKQWV